MKAINLVRRNKGGESIMVGGKVVEIVMEPHRIFLNVQDKTYPKDRCGIYVLRDADSEQVEVGDSVWWQGNKVFWTPEATLLGSDVVDYPLDRVSYSGVNHPLGNDVLDHTEVV
jgi:hypothetical protein